MEDFCAGCVGKKRFVMASATDRALKEYRDDLFYREMIESSAYVQNGYDTILQSGSENLRIDWEKNVKGLKVEFQARAQTTPNTLFGWIGYGAEANCVTFKNLRNVEADGTVEAGIPLRCLTELTEAEHAANQTRPALPAYFNAALRGRFLAYRIAVRGTGGGSCFSAVWLDVEQAER